MGSKTVGWSIVSRSSHHLLGFQLLGVIIIAVLETSPGLCGWPEGTYGIPSHRDGCPNDISSHWRTGSQLQKTESGSHASHDIHLLGISSQVSDRILQTFCMKTSYGSDDKHHFMPGKYCIFKKHECPSRFEEGWIYWDDAGPLFGRTIQIKTGTMPEGDFDRNTRIEYCCRADGVTHQPIVLPSDEPFYLLKHGDECQEVENMNVKEEWVYWSGESSFNLDSEGGIYPKIERSKSPFTFTRLFYCYYIPKLRVEVSLSSWFETFLVVMYIVGAIIGIVFLASVVLATAQRVLIFRRQRHQRRQQQQSQTVANGNRPGDRISKSGSGSSKGSSRSSDVPPNYASCKDPVNPPVVNGNGKVATPGRNVAQTQTSVVGDRRCSVESMNFLPDADSEAPPSYEEVLREGNPNAAVV